MTHSILLIDDNLDHLELNRAILERNQYKVFAATSGAEALQLLSTMTPPDLILLDLHMEDMSGLVFLSHLEEQQPQVIEQVPIVFFTGMDKVPKSKAVGFIRKPIDIDQLVEAVGRFIQAGTPSKPEPSK